MTRQRETRQAARRLWTAILSKNRSMACRFWAAIPFPSSCFSRENWGPRESTHSPQTRAGATRFLVSVLIRGSSSTDRLFTEFVCRISQLLHWRERRELSSKGEQERLRECGGAALIWRRHCILNKQKKRTGGATRSNIKFVQEGNLPFQPQCNVGFRKDTCKYGTRERDRDAAIRWTWALVPKASMACNP